jgi:hypothetical protein
MTTEPIRRIDHVSVLVADPQPLFSVLTTTLGLPVAWPIGQFVGFTGAGVGVGNVPLEIIRFAPRRRSRIPLDRGELAVALEPIPTPAAVAELDRRGIPHAPPVPYAGRADDTPASTYAGWSPGAGPLWTVTLLGGFFGDERLARSYSRLGSHSRAAGAATRAVSRATARLGLADAMLAASLPRRSWAFMCEYHRLDLAEARRVNRALLDETGGGPLGVVGLAEVVIEARDRDTELQRWEALLAPRRPNRDGRFELGHGPAIRVASGARDHQGLVFEVRSLEAAEAFARERGMLAREQGGVLEIEREQLGGLDLRLTEGDTSA